MFLANRLATQHLVDLFLQSIINMGVLEDVVHRK